MTHSGKTMVNLLDENGRHIEPLTNIDIKDLLFFEKKGDVIRLEDYINTSEVSISIGSDLTVEVAKVKKSVEKSSKKMYKRRKDKQCKVCDKTFTTTTKLNMHIRVHSGCKPFKCKECPKTFAQQFNLKRHELVHLPFSERPKKYQCHICGLFYWQKHHLSDHILAFHCFGGAEIVCEVCKKAVKNKNSYRMHRYKHVTFMENEI